MKFNSFIVQLDLQKASFNDHILHEGKLFNGHFIKIFKSIYLLHFKTQTAFKHLDPVKFRNREKEAIVLLPLFSKLNKRKLTKIAKILLTPEGRQKDKMIPNILLVEKFLLVEKLLEFLMVTRKEMLEMLVELELDSQIKIINLTQLKVTSYKNFEMYRDQLVDILEKAFQERKRALKISDIELQMKFPVSSTFFKYLLFQIKDRFGINQMGDLLIFQKIAITEKDRKLMDNIEVLLKKNRMVIFTVDNVLKISELPFQEVNDSLWFLLDQGTLIQLNEKYFMFNEDLKKILFRMKKHKRNQGEKIDIQDFREMTTLNRKNLIILFEYFDSQQITKRIGNARKILLNV